MKIDKETGLPELPEGYFWRVENGFDPGDGGVYPGIEVRLEKRTTKLRWFKRVPCSRTVENFWRRREDIDPGGVAVAIREVAAEIYNESKTYLPIHEEIDAEIESYVGDYPPKKLGAT